MLICNVSLKTGTTLLLPIISES